MDVLEDGSRRAGGTAFYSALQAARLGLRTLVLTRGRPGEIEQLLEPYAGELTLRVAPAASTTTLATAGEGEARVQRVLAWAGPLEGELESLDAAIVHLAPVARELTARELRAGFLGLTAQGLVRRWPGDGGEITLAPPPAHARELAARCDALVISRRERASAEQLIRAASAAGATTVVTAGPGPNTVVLGDGSCVERAVPPVSGAREDLGAGDVFAAALFAELAAGADIDGALAFADAAAAVRMLGSGADAVGDRVAIERRLASVATR